MFSSYDNYLINSQYYKNLNTGEVLIDELQEDIDSVNEVLKTASGNLIEQALSEINYLKTTLSNYKNQIEIIKLSLKANAVVYDTIYNNWKQQEGVEVSKGYFCDGMKLSSCPGGTPSDYRHPKAYKYVTKINKVYIDSATNLICVEYRDYFYGYSINNPGIFQDVSYRSVFNNRNSSLDFSSLLKVDKIDFSKM